MYKFVQLDDYIVKKFNTVIFCYNYRGHLCKKDEHSLLRNLSIFLRLYF